jgi:hypothetical protein
MLVASAILFVFPCCLLIAAWRRALLDKREIKLSTWRRYGIGFALVLATLATIASMIDMFSWFHNGGSPHGMNPGPGLWITFGPLSLKLMVAAFVVAPFGVRKGRWLLLSVPPSLFCVVALLSMLEMD